MKKFNFSKKFERLTSFVLALMLVLSVFTASNVAVFADTEDKNVKTKETQDQVDLYVKSSTVPCIKSSTEKNYQVMSAYANGYYSAKVNKAGTAVSSPDSADKAKYQLADFTMDDSKVYFVKPADWNSSDIKAHFGYSNDEANDIPMDSVSNSVFLKDSKSNTVSNLTLGNNEKLYSVTIPAGMTNVIFYYNNYEKQTNDIINISVGNCYKLTEGTTENGTIFNAESIGSVGSLNKLNKSYSFTESTVIDFTDFSAVKTLKMSDLNLKAGDTELSENSETVLEKSNDKFSVENANGFDVKVYYNNTEITSVSDIKEYDKKVSLTVKLSDIPDMTREYEVKVNSGLVIDGGKWQFNKTDVTSIENNINVYAPSSGKEFEVTPKFEPKLKCNGETVESGAKITYYNSHDKEIQKLEFTNSDSQTLKYKVSYNNYTVTGEITVNCYFVSVALTSLKSDTNSFVDESKETIYQKGESCSYDVKLDSNLTAKDINFSIDNGAKVDYSSSSNSNKLTISNLTKESNLTIKYPTEEGFEVKKYKVVPDNKAPEIEEIKFDSENAKFDVDNGLYKNGDITFTIKLKNEDSGSGIFDGSLTGNDVFSCNFDQSKNVFNCTLRDKTINGDTVFTITDRVGNKESFSFNKLIDSGKVYVYNTPITNNNFEVVSSTEKPTANISSYNATGTNAFNDNNIYHGDQLTVTLDLNNVISGLQSISGLSVSGFESYNFSNFKLTKINEKEQSVTANSFDELATEFENQATNEKVKSATVTFDIDIKDNPNYSGSHKLSLTVTDNSGNVNSGVDNSTFYVDNTAPEITNVEFVKTTNPTVTDQILNFLTFGIYSNDTIVMNVTATDYAPTSGLPSDTITVKNGESVISGSSATADSNATENSTVIYSYELGNKDSAYDLSFTVKDNAGNTATKSLVDLIKEDKEKTKKVVVANADFTADFTKDDYDNITDFEVVSNNEEDFTFIDTFTGTDEKEYDDNDNIIRHGKSINVTSQVKVSNKAGVNNISNIECYYYNDDQNTENKVTVSADEKYDYSSKKTTSAKINFNITTKETGKYILKYTATNNAGVSKTNTKTFYVDNTAPEITKVEFSKQSSAVDQILNFLTFGIYSNDTIVMNVTATDKAPTSGLPSDTITVKNGESVKESETEESNKTADSNATDSSTVTYSYELGNSDSAYNLSFTVKDNAGNTATKSLVDLIKEDKEKTEKVVVANANITKVDYDKIEGFEVVSNNEENFTFTDTFTGADKKVYDVNDNIIRHGESINVKSQVEVSDKAGINNISNIECYYKDDQKPENKVNVSAAEKYDYSSKKTISAEINFNITTKETGKYILKYTATNNAGVSKTNTKTFYVDNTAPVISQFTFKNGNPAKNPDSVIKTEYGYYFKNTTTVEVTAVDGGVDSPVSGVSEIHFYTIGTDGIQSDEQIVSVSGNNQTSYKATFTVPANFKGNVYAYAVDKAGNCYYFDTTTNKDDSQPVTPDRVVVENSSKHEQMSGIDISLPATNYIESSNKLYNNDVNVALNVSDSYSGIAKIEYSVSSEFDTDNNWDGSIEYSNDQSATTAMNGNGTVSGWKIEESDQNLVTKASSTITVKNNSNNIKIEVKLTDRAGNVSTKKETLSIDKTKPTIKIEYDNNNHTTHNGTEFYKANRTATITVTERNFSPEDVISKITNTDNVIPQITGWTTHNVANGENPDGTTHTATVVYASDGDYIFDIAFTDMAGNKADKVAQHKFTVDKTIPTINVSFDNNSAKNNNYYKADRTATITVNEHNFNAQDVKVNISATVADKSTAATAPSVSSWTSNGNIHTATVKFANDGKYAFDVNYTDLADNAAKENVVTTFYVDKTAPAVKISNVENESANSGNVAPVINLGDNNYSGDYVLTLTRVDIEAKKTDVTNDFVSTVVPTSNTGAVVTYANFASDEVNDGIYVLNAALTDKAGNSSNDTITFSVNRFGSTYMGGNKETNDLLDNGYTNAEKDIVISEINVDKLTKSNISLSLDSSSLKTLKQNVDYTVNEDAKTGQWHKYNYTVKSSNFVNEGNYSIELSSTDAAKNTSTNRIRPIENRKLAVQFVVDKTAPVVNIAGIENNALYEENSKDVTVVCEDSYIDANSLVIKLDDKTLKEGKDYTVEKDVASISAKIKVNATSDITAQNVKVSVKDMAQNSGDGSVENFTLSATLLMRFFANPVLVIISAVLFAGIIALVIFIVAKKRRKN